MEKSENHTDLYVEVVLPLAVPLYTYRVPNSLHSSVKIGCRVVVQVGMRKMYTAIVYAIHTTKPETSVTIKDVESVIDENPVVTAFQLQIWDWISDYYMCTRGEVMKAALPSGMKLESETVLSVNPVFDCMTLTETDRYAFTLIEKNEGVTVSELARMMGKKSVTNQVQKLVSVNAVVAGETISNQYKPKLKTYITLTKPCSDSAFVDLSFSMLSKAAKQQEAFLNLLNLFVLHKHEENFAVEKSEFLKQTSPQVLTELQKKGIIAFEERVVSRFAQSIATKGLATLSDMQQKALNEIQKSFETMQFCLLHGVTSSGKTEVYIHLIQQAISEGKQVLYLLPEIALTSQIINRLRNVFGDKVGVYHSRFSDNERIEVWNNLLEHSEKSYQIILGVRSSIFLPFNKLSLIIVDEEHETSFKQYDPAPRYNARDVAYILAMKSGAKLLLGTATPSLETYYNVLTKKVALVELTARHTTAPLPEIHIIDLQKERKQKRMHDDVFSKTMLERITENLAAGKQVILFQNRRGYSPYLECPDCGHVPQCVNCDVSLTYHKFSNTLMCHHCGYAIPYTVECPECHKKNMRLVGFGTEKIEDTLKEVFPKSKIARMDLDTTRGKNAYAELIDAFENHEIDILVGTQMITKGLDFENVGMVGILGADSLLRFPDFRSYERAFHLMVQVAGRAGRSESQGHVYIQTYQPTHPILKFVQENDYHSLLDSQMLERRNFWYPPFTRLIKVTVKNRDVEKVKTAARILATDFRKINNILVLGPEFPPIPRIQTLYAQDILLKVPRNLNFTTIRNAVRQAMNAIVTLEEYKTTSFSINVDPY